MKVAIFTDNDFDKINGVTTTLTALLRHAPAEIAPRIYTAATLGTDQPDYFALPSVGVGIPFYREMKMYVPHWRRYLDRVRADGIDVLHLTTPGPMGLTAVWIAAQTGLPLVGSFHTDLAAYTQVLSGSPRLGRWMREYMRWMYGRCARVLVPSEATRQLLVRAKSPIDQMRLWTRGVDTDHFTPRRRSESLRRAWRVSDERPAVLYVGRVSKEKGLGLLPSLQEALASRGVHHRLVIAGEGPLLPELRRWCADAVFTGPLGRDRVADAFASADAFVFPSQTDTAGNVVLEAQASGLPVAVSNVGGPQENMRDGVTGVVSSEATGGAWADALVPMLTSIDTRRAMGHAAREYTLTRRWDAALAPVFDAYREMAERRSPRAA
jgi:glycosyltransferase involved in cell wall biosynthesis